MKSYIIKGHPWIYLLYSFLLFVTSINGLIKGEISTAIGILLLFSTPLFILYLIKRKTYIKFSNKKVCENLQEKRYSLKMKETEIDVDNIESIEICKIAKWGMWFLIVGLVVTFPILIRRIWHRKIIIHQKSGKNLQLSINPIGYDNTVKLFLQQYTKEKAIKIINSGEKEINNEIGNKKVDVNTTLEQDIEYQEEQEKNNETKNIDINDLFKSMVSSNFIDIEMSGDNIKDNKSNTINKNIKYVVLALFIGIILFCGMWGYINKKQKTNNQKIINSLMDNNGNIDYGAIYQLKNLKGIDDETKKMVDELINCPSIMQDYYNSDLNIFLDVSEFKNVDKINIALSDLKKIQNSFHCLCLVIDIEKKYDTSDWNYKSMSDYHSIVSKRFAFSLWIDSYTKLYLYLLPIQDYLYYDDEGILRVSDDSIYDELLKKMDAEEKSFNNIQSILEKI